VKDELTIYYAYVTFFFGNQSFPFNFVICYLWSMLLKTWKGPKGNVDVTGENVRTKENNGTWL